MAFIPAPGCVRVSVLQDNNEENVVNVFWVKPIMTIDASVLTAIMTAIASRYNSDWSDVCHGDWSVTKLVAQDWSSANGLGGEYIPGVQIVGQAAGTGVTGAASALISWNTAFRGKSFRGRTYLAGGAATYAYGNEWAAALVNCSAQFATGLRTDLSGSGFPLQVVSFAANHIPRLVAVASEITGNRSRTKIRSQRRRNSSLNV